MEETNNRAPNSFIGTLQEMYCAAEACRGDVFLVTRNATAQDVYMYSGTFWILL